MSIYSITYTNGLARQDGIVADMPDYKNFLTDWFANHTDMPTPLKRSYRVYWEELRALYRYAGSITITNDEIRDFCNCVMRSISFIFDNFGTLYDKYNTEFYIEVR